MEIKIDVPDESIASQICSGLESGDLATFGIIPNEYIPPTKGVEWKFRFDKKHLYPHIDYPMNEGGSVALFLRTEAPESEEGKKVYRLDRVALQKGLLILQQKYPHHFAAILSEEGDAMTGDSFLQCCLLGDIVYG